MTNCNCHKHQTEIITDILHTIHRLHHYEEKRYDNDEITGAEYITYISAYTNIQKYILDEYGYLIPKEE